MNEFMYLFRGGITTASPQERQQHMGKWRAWMEELGRQGILKKPGAPLEGTGKVVKGAEKTIIDGPYAETKDIVGGYIIVEARDLDHAVEISKGCPIFETDGMVEVRPVMAIM